MLYIAIATFYGQPSSLTDDVNDLCSCICKCLLPMLLCQVQYLQRTWTRSAGPELMVSPPPSKQNLRHPSQNLASRQVHIGQVSLRRWPSLLKRQTAHRVVEGRASIKPGGMGGDTMKNGIIRHHRKGTGDMLVGAGTKERRVVRGDLSQLTTAIAKM